MTTMTKCLTEDELLEVAGGVNVETYVDAEWDFVITCSCGYCRHVKTLKDATEELLEHVGDSSSHDCHITAKRKKQLLN